MTPNTREPFVTYLELRESTVDGDVGAGLSHTSKGLVLLHVLELAADGEPRGAVTVVHDAGDHGGRYMPFARDLAASGWAVALPDLRGHGKSEGARGHTSGVKEIVRDLGDVQDHLAYRQPDAPKVLVGQGLGALWCLAYACEKPEGVAALVLVSPLLSPRFELPERAGGLAKLWKKVGPTSPGRTGWSADRRTSDAAQARAIDADKDVHGIVTLRAGEEALEVARGYVPKIATLAMPVLVLAGTNDEIAPIADARKLKAARVDVIEFESARHDLFHEAQSREITASVTRWLDTKLPR
ncbi:MAG: alpha/beta fold hydrolase [Planctomycetota bacterium]|nr:alpha/beta fold hydrolase [Planctomycetota bacterium]